ncbi:MAG: HPr kinase/phosphorylase [Pseudomonadota bacterium]
MNLHATCVAIGECGVLLRGPSGCGKSDLALRLIDQYADVMLVADDRVDVTAADGALYASPPPRIAGLLEVRGVGIVPVAHRPRVKLGLLADLQEAQHIPRLPEPLTEAMLGIRLPRLLLAPFEASAAARLRQALRQMQQPGIRPS